MRILQIAVNLETDFYENHKSGLNDENIQLCGRLNQTTILTSIEDTSLQLPYAIHCVDSKQNPRSVSPFSLTLSCSGRYWISEG